MLTKDAITELVGIELSNIAFHVHFFDGNCNELLAISFDCKFGEHYVKCFANGQDLCIAKGTFDDLDMAELGVVRALDHDPISNSCFTGATRIEGIGFSDNAPLVESMDLRSSERPYRVINEGDNLVITPLA